MSLYDKYHSQHNKTYMYNLITDIIKKDHRIDMSSNETYNHFFETNFLNTFQTIVSEDLKDFNKHLLDTQINYYKDFILPKKLIFELNDNPDLAQTISVTCFGLGIACDLYGLKTLKIKETDRLKALKNELEKLGAKVNITNQSLHLKKRTKFNPDVIIDTYEDHRMAMAFTPLALLKPIIINNPKVISKSFPSFWMTLSKLCFEISEY